MNSTVLGLYAETPLHVGVGQERSAVDLPVAREAPTPLPFIPASGLKGAMRSAYHFMYQPGSSEAAEGPKPEEQLFGYPPDSGETSGSIGALGVFDARLVALPVRSMDRPFNYVTSQEIVQRTVRLMKIAGQNVDIPWDYPVGDTALCSGSEGEIVLDALTVSAVRNPEVVSSVAALIEGLTTDLSANDIEKTLVILPEAQMSWLARYALPVRARNRLDGDTKTVVSGALWYEETVPVGSVFASLLTMRHALPGGNDPRDALLDVIGPYLQVGGNESIGQGWMQLTTLGDQS